MNARAHGLRMDDRSTKPMAYDPENLHPDDEEARKYDEATTDIDWDEIIATTQDDFIAGRYCFSTGDYATHEEGMAALWQWMCTLGEGESDEAACTADSDAKGA